MDSTSVPLRLWVLAIHLLRRGTTQQSFIRALGVKFVTARRLEMKIRAAWEIRKQGLGAKRAEGQGRPVASRQDVDAGPRRTRGRPPKVLERIDAAPRDIAAALFPTR